MHADLPAGGHTADTRRAERVAHIGALIANLYAIAVHLDNQEAQKAIVLLEDCSPLCEQLEAAIRGEAQAIGEGQPGSEGLHAQDSEHAQVT